MYINRIFHVKDSRTESKIYTNSFIFGVLFLCVFFSSSWFSLSLSLYHVSVFHRSNTIQEMRESYWVNSEKMPEHSKAEKYANRNYCVLCLNVSIYIVYIYSTAKQQEAKKRKKKIVTILIVHTKHFAFHLQVLNWPENKWFIFHFYNHRFFPLSAI